MQRIIIALISGLIFGAGLVISEMVNPTKVQDFLDLFGNWDSSLAFVMGGAVAVTLVTSRFILKRKTPIFAERFYMAVKTSIDARLVVGASLFGLGWGLSGYCPGPGILNAMINPSEALVFLPALIIGGWIGQRYSA
ncbi:MAG TPA: YeeE/YedE family protein [Oceanospirillaceae bacterium]|nr:YeeE/YedE family protein [Oceanospirillaceae bacterium]